MERKIGTIKLNTIRSGYWGREKSSAVKILGMENRNGDGPPSTSSGADHTQRSQLVVVSEADRRAAPPDKGHHSGVEEAEAGHHMGPRKDDAGVGSLQSEDAGECDVHIHRGHSSPGGWEWAIVHGSDPGDCIHGVRRTFGRIHPWEGRAGEGSETDTGHGRDALHRVGSGVDQMGIHLRVPGRVAPLHPQRMSRVSL
jgi:hypothetical protein